MLELLTTKGKGQGVFTTEPILPETTVLHFGGPLIVASAMPMHIEVDHYLQIDKEWYLGPSGQIDDYINHSCQPSCAVIFDPFNQTKVSLMSLRRIEKGSEITFDYSLTSTIGVDVFFICRCRAPNCRGGITGYQGLSPEVKAGYMALGIVPEYVK